MLMKSLIALALLAGRALGWAPEAITRLPNALAGGVSVGGAALLARRLFGRAVGVWDSSYRCIAFLRDPLVARRQHVVGAQGERQSTGLLYPRAGE